jgi:hypothetical protein
VTEVSESLVVDRAADREALFAFVFARATEAAAAARTSGDQIDRRGSEHRLRILELMRAQVEEFPDSGEEVDHFLLRTAAAYAGHRDYRPHWWLGAPTGAHRS